MTIVGSYKFSPTIFYDLLFKEAELIIRGHKQQEKEQFNLWQIAVINGVGSCFGGKKFKPIEPFKKEEKSSNVKKKTQEELLEELKQVKKSFNRE